MVEIRYGNNREAAELAGLTVEEAREQFRTGFGIPNKARAILNGGKVKRSLEIDTVLNDDDELAFAVPKHRGAYLVGATLLALAVTGGVFAYGFVNASTTLSATVAEYNFADVSVNTTGISSLTWSGYGFFKGGIPANASNNGTPIYNIDTQSSGYTGDLVVSVSIANGDQLAKRYRTLAMKIAMCYPDGSLMDINESGAADANDWVMLTLNNGTVSMYTGGTANTTTVRVLGGYYITHARPFAGWEGSASPELYCEVSQR
jgi:hypothetical protein